MPTLIHDSFPITPEDDCFSVQILWIVDVFPKKIRKHLQRYFPEFRSCIPEISNPNTQCHLSSPGHHALRSHPRLVADSVSSAPCTGNCCSVRIWRSDATQLCQIHLQKRTYSSPNRLLKASRSVSKPVLILCRFLYWLICQLDCQLCRLLYQLHCHPFSRLLGCRRHPK